MDKKEEKSIMETAKVVRIKWKDAVADIGWEEEVKAELHNCTTIGFVVAENNDAICIASTVSIDQTNARLHIPKKWITDKKEIVIEDQLKKKQRKNTTTMGKRSDNSTITFEN